MKRLITLLSITFVLGTSAVVYAQASVVARDTTSKPQNISINQNITCFSQWVPETNKCYWVCKNWDTGTEWRREIAC